MRPEQIGDVSVPSDPRIHPDGVQAAFVVTRMDLEADRYVRRIWLWDGDEARPLTGGPFDSSPRWSPDGSRLAFLRKGEEDEDVPQLAILPMVGGEAEIVGDFSLGVSEIAWSPEGDAIAVVATEWTDDWKDLDPDQRMRAPRRITTLGFRFDNRGWLHDRRSHVWLVEPGGGAPRCLTPGDFNETEVCWHPNGQRLVFSSARHDTRSLDPATQIWAIGRGGGSVSPQTEPGGLTLPSFDRDGLLHAIGLLDAWGYPDVAPLWRKEDDGTWSAITGELDRNLVTFAPPISPVGPQWLEDGTALATVEDSGRLGVIRIDPGAPERMVIGGDRQVTGISPRPDGSAAVFTATAPTDPGEVFWWDGETERRLTTLNDEFRAGTTLSEPERFTITHDETEIEGWVYLPPGEEKVPLLLNIHGGPATQYGYGFFDEFQVYAGAGYGVVAINPRGSTGYGSGHGRAIVGAWPEDEPPDLRDLLAAPGAAARASGRLDLERMGVMGGSYGGFATVRVLAADDRYRSGIAERGLYTFTSFSGTSDIGMTFDGFYLGRDGRDHAALWAASPLRFADRITTPTLVLHSEGDWRTPIEQGEQLFAVLSRNGVETEFVRFPGEGHELSRSGKPQHRVERFAVVLDWHERHLR